MFSSFSPADYLDWTMPVIWSRGPEAGGRERVAQSGATPASNAWPNVNDAILVPFYVTSTAVFKNAYVYNGAAVAGNVDVGIYDEAGNRMCSTGAVAQAGTSVIQVIPFTANTTLVPGRYYMALSCSSASATVFASGASTTFTHHGPYRVASAHPLPNPITFATWVSVIFPLFGVSTLAF